MRRVIILLLSSLAPVLGLIIFGQSYILNILSIICSYILSVQTYLMACEYKNIIEKYARVIFGSLLFSAYCIFFIFVKFIVDGNFLLDHYGVNQCVLGTIIFTMSSMIVQHNAFSINIKNT